MRKLILTTAAVAAALCLLAGCSKKSVQESVSETFYTLSETLDTLTDGRDGRKYRTVAIGGKTWMAENLNTDGGICYEDSASYCDKYGKLYDYYMAKSLCPSGWRLPTITDWGDLIRAAGGEKVSDGGDDDEDYADYSISWRGAGKMLRAKSGWDDFQGKNGVGTDGYGFSALPGGGCFDLNYDCNGAGRIGRWWTATEVKPGHSYYVDINDADSVDADYTENYYSFSVRCIQKDSAWYNLEAKEREERKKEAKQWKKEAKERFVSNYFTDSRDKQKYRAVKIDGKTWMAENLNYAANSSWCYDNDDSYCDKYGRLYDWKTAAAACPSGWHLPTRVEWDRLVTAAGGGTIAGKKLKSENSWDERGHSGTDDYGFSALSGGIRDADDSRFKYADGYGAWWTATETYCREMYDSEHGGVSESDYNTNSGLSVRCVRNDSVFTVTVSSAGVGANGGGDYAKGETVAVTAGTAIGRRFKDWTSVNSGVTFADKYKRTTSFTMPARNVTVTANFDAIDVDPETFTDFRNGRTYKTVVIGGKRWMAENLNIETGNSWCYDRYNSNCNKYGRLYDFQTAKTACPSGWHLPSNEEWKDLSAAAGAFSVAGELLKSTSGWKDNNGQNGDGTDGYYFSAVPGGRRSGGIDKYDGRFSGAGFHGYWWTATERGEKLAYYWGMRYDSGIVDNQKDHTDAAFSVRCLQDKSGGKPSNAAGQRKNPKDAVRPDEKNTVYFTDTRDGQKYRAAVIGGKTWMAQNLNYRTSTGSWCYGNDTSLCGKFGRLYEWNTAKTACPKGWHLPSRREWYNLGEAVGGDRISKINGTFYWYAAGTILKARTGWYKYKSGDGDCNGTDDYGFSALPGGRSYADRIFEDIGTNGTWWTATKADSGRAYGMGIYLLRGENMNETIYNVTNKVSYLSGQNKRDEDENELVYDVTNKVVYGSDQPKRGEYEKETVYEVGVGHSVRCLMDSDSGKPSNLTERKKDAKEKKKEAERTIERGSGYVTDSRDGRIYRVVKIGGKSWMAQNLNYQPQTGKSWCYGNSASNCDSLGRLYDWYTAKRAACLPDWHLPTEQEWDDLTTAVGGKKVAGEKLKAASGWGGDGNGSDDYGFSALPGGYRQYILSDFSGVGYVANWWTASADRDSKNAYARLINHYYGDVNEYNGDKNDGFSVRCVADRP